jgi:hypothetical protein
MLPCSFDICFLPRIKPVLMRSIILLHSLLRSLLSFLIENYVLNRIICMSYIEVTLICSILVWRQYLYLSNLVRVG